MWKELIFAGRHRRSRTGNDITVGVIFSLLILFSTLSYFHIEGLYAQNLKSQNGANHVSNQALVQSMPYSIYATMMAEDDTYSAQLIHDTLILS